MKIYSGKCNDFCKVNYNRPDEISLSYRGWGSFVLPITIHFKDHFCQNPVIFNHKLDFDKNERLHVLPVFLNKIKFSHTNENQKAQTPELNFKIKCKQKHFANFIFEKPYKLGRTDCNECRNPVFLADGFFHCEKCKFDLCSICYEKPFGTTFTKVYEK